MSVLSSLTNRIFLASALLLVVSIGIAIYRVTDSVSRRAETELRDRACRGRRRSSTNTAGRSSTNFVAKGKLIADLPVLKNAAATDDPPTVQPIADRLPSTISSADLFVVARPHRTRPGPRRPRHNRTSRRSPASSTPAATARTARRSGRTRAACCTRRRSSSSRGRRRSARCVDRLQLDQDAARRFKALTNSEIAFALGPTIVASTLDPERSAEIGGFAESDRDVQHQDWRRGLRSDRSQPLGAGAGPAEPVALVLRSRTEHLSFLPTLRWQIALTGLAAVLVATLVGYGIARTVTRPLRALTATMREMAATGDLARTVPAVGRWDDEDARLLSTTFGQLTGALGRFQREAAQRERLSSLGRLSTVIAHEIRNPLMIIKSAVRSLRQHPSPDVTEVAANIDEEVQRLNRVVTDVLDFARPIRFELAPADLGDICRDAAQAAKLAARRRPGRARDA